MLTEIGVSFMSKKNTQSLEYSELFISPNHGLCKNSLFKNKDGSTKIMKIIGIKEGMISKVFKEHSLTFILEVI